jgi:phosphatidate cytidylyltransferase
MKRVLTAAVLVPVVLLIVFRAPLWLFALAVAAIVVLALREYLGIMKAAGITPFYVLTYAAGILPTLSFLPVLPSLITLLFLLPVIFVILLVFRKDLQGGLASVAGSIFGVLYISFSLSLLIELRASSVLSILILFILFSVWAGDIAAYYVGRAFGRHKLAPVVSPNKSWEGAIASIIASIIIALLIFYFRYPLITLFSSHSMTGQDSWTFHQPLQSLPVLYVIVLGILTNVAAQLGDLFESALKRGAGVKDSGTLLPGHGGILDRIDALLFAIPVVWYYATQTGLLTKMWD